MFGKNKKENVPFPELTPEEREYFDEYRNSIESEDELTAGEIKLFEKLAVRMKISPERAKELENMASGRYFTPEELEYYNDVLECLGEDGEITETAARLLEKTRKLLMLTKERTDELEELAFEDEE